MRIRKVLIPTPLVIALLLVTGIGVATVYYQIIKPATFEIQLNTFAVDLFVDEECTAIASVIQFGNFMIGTPGQTTVTSGTLYLKATDLEQSTFVYVSTDCTLTLTSEKAYPATTPVWNTWDDTTAASLSTTSDMMYVRFTIDVSTAPVGNYDFSIDIKAADS